MLKNNIYNIYTISTPLYMYVYIMRMQIMRTY